jgi:hypothetical protein
VPGHRLVLDAGGRQVETTLYLDGKTVRMDSRETHASPEAARKALDRLTKLLGGEGYKAGGPAAPRRGRRGRLNDRETGHPPTRSAATTVWPRAKIDSQAGWSFVGRS